MIEQIRALPTSAGIYQYLDEKGRILYIGKAKNLAKRVRSYFNLTPSLRPKQTLSLRIQKMLSETRSLHYLIVENEHDALLLENSLIKQLSPKYNILLRDDKTYPYIYLNLDDSFPRFEITRKVITGKKIRYFGPFSAGARDILDSLYELLPLVQKKSCLKGKKACLFYQMKQCLGPCEFAVDPTLYASFVSQGIEWIQNKHQLLQELETKMELYAEELRFEECTVLRNRIETIQRSTLHSPIDLANNTQYDVFAIASDTHRGCIVRLFIRNGKITSSSHDFFTVNECFSIDEAYERTLVNYYGHEKPPIIAPILVAEPFESLEWVKEHLSTLFEKKAILETPKQGVKKELLNLALSNAKELLRTPKNSNTDLLEQIQQLCSLENLPERIEVFDNSHFAGQAPVGAMISYDNGALDKRGYRIFHLQHHDEYSQMKELLTRRINAFSDNPPPDLWVLDGGETLRSLAMEVLHSHGIFLDVIAISKEKVNALSHRAKGAAHDILHTSNGELRLAASDKRLMLIQMLRDEAHRSAISFHKKTKLKLDQESKLLSLNGITPGKIQKLLEYYGTFEGVAHGDFETLKELVGTKDAKAIINYYSSPASK